MSPLSEVEVAVVVGRQDSGKPTLRPGAGGYAFPRASDDKQFSILRAE